jgi:hypothetical protein
MLPRLPHALQREIVSYLTQGDTGAFQRVCRAVRSRFLRVKALNRRDKGNKLVLSLIFLQSDCVVGVFGHIGFLPLSTRIHGRLAALKLKSWQGRKIGLTAKIKSLWAPVIAAEHSHDNRALLREDTVSFSAIGTITRPLLSRRPEDFCRLTSLRTSLVRSEELALICRLPALRKLYLEHALPMDYSYLASAKLHKLVLNRCHFVDNMTINTRTSLCQLAGGMKTLTHFNIACAERLNAAQVSYLAQKSWNVLVLASACAFEPLADTAIDRLYIKRSSPSADITKLRKTRKVSIEGSVYLDPRALLAASISLKIQTSDDDVMSLSDKSFAQIITGHSINVSYLSDLKELRELSITWEEKRRLDFGINGFRALTRLRVLKLDNISCDDLAPLDYYPLETLTLSRCLCNDITTIRDSKTLRAVYLYDCVIGRGVPSLGKIKSLRTLYMERTIFMEEPRDLCRKALSHIRDVSGDSL